MKLPVQIRLDGDIIKWCKERDINISETTNTVLRHLKDSESISAEELALAMLQAEKDNLVRLIEGHKAQIDRLLESTLLSEEKINKQAAVIKELRKSERIANLIKQLNEALEQCSFDFEAAWKLPVLDELRKEGLIITEGWLRRHIQRIDLMGR